MFNIFKVFSKKSKITDEKIEEDLSDYSLLTPFTEPKISEAIATFVDVVNKDKGRFDLERIGDVHCGRYFPIYIFQDTQLDINYVFVLFDECLQQLCDDDLELIKSEHFLGASRLYVKLKWKLFLRERTVINISWLTGDEREFLGNKIHNHLARKDKVKRYLRKRETHEDRELFKELYTIIK